MIRIVIALKARFDGLLKTYEVSILQDWHWSCSGFAPRTRSHISSLLLF